MSAIRYTRFLNKVSLARKPSAIRVLTAIAQSSPPSMISMAGGMPNADTFPLTAATFTLRDGGKIVIEPASMKQALQYSATPGIPDLVDWVSNLQEMIHQPPTMPIKDPEMRMDCIITNGSQDGMCKAFEALVNEGDNILMETPCYSGTLAIVQPLGCNILPVNADHHGMKPEHLREILSKWKPSDADDPKSDIPRLLYCIPNGGNPTGHSLTEDRKHALYNIAREYNLLILEDDPYFYLQFAKPYVPSLLSMDADGRVLRFDSFSKLMSSGMRLGWCSGPKAILDRISLHMQASVMHASGFSQMVLLQILNKMGYEGFKRHASTVAEFYLEQRNACLAAAEKHLTGLAEWSAPAAGMFLWLKLLNVPDTYKIITVRAREKDVLFVPGNAFTVDDTQPSPYVRASYSVSTPEQMDMAFKRLAEIIKEEQQK